MKKNKVLDNLFIVFMAVAVLALFFASVVTAKSSDIPATSPGPTPGPLPIKCLPVSGASLYIEPAGIVIAKLQPLGVNVVGVSGVYYQIERHYSDTAYFAGYVKMSQCK